MRALVLAGAQDQSARAYSAWNSYELPALRLRDGRSAASRLGYCSVTEW